MNRVHSKQLTGNGDFIARDARLVAVSLTAGSAAASANIKDKQASPETIISLSAVTNGNHAFNFGGGRPCAGGIQLTDLAGAGASVVAVWR